MKIRTFLQALIKSIISPLYYLDVLNAPFKFSLKFFLLSFFCLSLLATFFFIQFDIPTFQELFRQNKVELQKSYPSQLVLSWNGNELQKTTPKLVEVSYPFGLPHQDLPEKFAYIDTSADSVEDVTKEASAKSLFVMTKTTLYVSSNQGDWSSLALKDTPGFDKPFTINKASLPQYLSHWQDIFETSLSSFTFIYPFAYFFIIGFFRLFTLLMNSVFVFYLLKLLGKKLPYKKVLQLGLHVVIVASLLEILTSHLIPADLDLNIYGLSYWVYTIIILTSLWNVKNIIIFKSNEHK